MFPGMDSRKLAQMMKRMGIKQSEIKAQKVIIQTDDSEIIFNQPYVTKIDMMGEISYQIIGEGTERKISAESNNEIEISEDDIQLVIEQTGISKEKALETLTKTNGDIAKAILIIKEGNKE